MSNQIVLVNMVDTDSALFLNGNLVYSFSVDDGEYGELEDQIVGTIQEKLQAELVVVDLEKYDGWDWDNVAQKLKAQGIMNYIGAWELYKMRQIGIEYKPSRFSARVAQPNTEATDKLPQILHLVGFELAGVAVVVEILAKEPLDAIGQVKQFFSV